MRIGYGRVSTQDQDPEAQHDALQTAGCDEIFIDATSGKLARRPELDKALLSANRAGYQLVVITLDRLGRSLEHLIELAKHLQARGVDLVVLDQGIDTSTAVGRLFFQILGAIAEPRPSTQPVDPHATRGHSLAPANPIELYAAKACRLLRPAAATGPHGEAGACKMRR